MPKIKIKSRKAFSKRFAKKTANGKLKRGKSNTSHLFGNKTSRQRKSSRKVAFLSESDLKRARKMINHKST
ncbi:bL35 family ribosomal protein [endosymbiont GvMRE of Glomus versiforme]|uniref:bL35 family ribosomal protein n=1 Tax=endosymbiont GvMRE of Glomus versiforme TaxID=2039283 RepID=UPI000EC33A2C|nr:50S ribosomal protein L35 [endosymbiont GvMRE of Glomus versiforme]RHZ36436.1 50S ribosomal protein L35 [endosymbiont GvMRE of Glomus versiforme]